MQTGQIRVIGQIGQFYPAGHWVHLEGADILQVIYPVSVGQQIDCGNNLLWEFHPELFQRDRGMFHNVVEQRHGTGYLILICSARW